MALGDETLPELLAQPSEPDEPSVTLLQQISADKAKCTLSKLVVPLVVLHDQKLGAKANAQGLGSRLSRPSSGGLGSVSKSTSSSDRASYTKASFAIEPRQMLRCLALGAMDVLPSPLTEDSIAHLVVHAYHVKEEVQRERSALLATKKTRKRSWVGFDDKKPYAYLREQM